MPDQLRVKLLLEELIESGASPEEVCATCLELLPIVRERWRQICQARAEFDALLPIHLHDDPQSVRSREQPFGQLQGYPQIDGYAFESELGRGGMGIVFLARHLRLNRLIAIKMGLAGLYATPSERERFRREAEAVAALQHPNIVQVHDVGDADGRPYFTMEYLRGGSLAQKLAGTPLPAQEAAALMVTLSEAMHATHLCGIVHRDLKPGNILYTPDGIPKITDFGLARRLENGAGLTLTGATLGTPSYMAPEQGRGQTRDIGPAVDVYSLGAILYELLTGRPPFRAETPAETIHQLIHQDPVPPSQLNSKVPRALETICLMCLRKEPALRYTSAAELSADLRRFLRHEPIMARPVGPLGRLGHWVRRYPGLAGSLSAVALLLMILAAGSLVAMLHFRERGNQDRLRAVKMTQLADENGRLANRFRWDLYCAEMNLCGQAATAHSGISLVNELLMRWMDAKPDLRGWEWYYLYGICHRDVDTVSVADAGLWWIATSPDGETLAALGGSSVVYLFDTDTREVINQLTGHAGPVSAVAWSPNGSQLASACRDGTITTWDVKTATVLRTIHNQDVPIYTVAWNADGTRLAAAGENPSVWIWDATNGELLQRLDGHLHEVRGMAWHPSENRLATGGLDAEIRIWDLDDPEHPMVLSDHGNWVNSVVWHPDGIRLASVSNDQSCNIWDTRDGTVISTLTGHSQAVHDVCWSVDGMKLATCGEDQTIRIWNTEDGRELAALRGHTAKVTSIGWCNRIRQLVSCSQDGTLKFWSDETRGEVSKLIVHGCVNDLAWSSNGMRIAAAGGDGPLLLLDPTEREPPIVFGDPLRVSVTLSVSSNGKLLASGGFDQTIHVWDVDSVAEVRVLSGNREQIQSLQWSHLGSKLAAGDAGGNIFVWDADNGSLLLTLGDQEVFCFAIAWSPDDRHLASAWGDGSVRLYDVDLGKEIWSKPLHTDSAMSVAWSIDGKSIASAGADCLIQICHAANGARTQTLQGHTNAVTRVAWHPGGDRLASASGDRSVKVWDPKTGKMMLTFLDPSSQMKTVAWSPGGKTLAAGSEDGRIIFFDAISGFEAAGVRVSAQ